MCEIRVLNATERSTAQEILRNAGIELAGGSQEVSKEGQVRYNVGIDYNVGTYNAKKLGEKLKDALGADIIYIEGRLAT